MKKTGGKNMPKRQAKKAAKVKQPKNPPASPKKAWWMRKTEG
jgi:hypothetical protein